MLYYLLVVAVFHLHVNVQTTLIQDNIKMGRRFLSRVADICSPLDVMISESENINVCPCVWPELLVGEADRARWVKLVSTSGLF